MADAIDGALRVPWHTCACGFAGTMIHVFARAGGHTVADAVRALGGRGRTADDFAATESAATTLSDWWREKTAVPLYQRSSDEWPLDREPFLTKLGVEPSRLAIDALDGRLILDDRCGRPFRPIRRPKKEKRPRSRPSLHLPLYSAPGRLFGVYEVFVINREGHLDVRTRAVVNTDAPLWSGDWNCQTAEAGSSPLAYLKAVVLGRPAVFSSKPAEAATALGLPLAVGENDWYDVTGRAVIGPDGFTPPVLTAAGAAASLMVGGRFVVVRGGRLLAADGTLLWPVVYTACRLVLSGSRRWLRIKFADRYEWMEEDHLRNWIKERLPIDKRTALSAALVAAAYAGGAPSVTKSEQRFGWDRGCHGFGVPGGLVTAGAFEKQPWRGDVPAAGYPGRWVVEMGALSPAERLATGGLVRRWVETIGGRPLTAPEQMATAARPDRTRRLVGFLLWLTASTDRIARAEAGVTDLFGEWVRSERGYPLPAVDRPGIAPPRRDRVPG